MTDAFPVERRLPRGELVIALGVLALAGVVYWQSASIPVSPIFAKVGPTVVPHLIAAVLAALGALLVLSAVRGGWQPLEEKESTPDRAALAWIAAGLTFNAVLIGPLGFTLASTLMFTCVARGFGSQRPARDAALGLVMALASYFGFAKVLGINIGAGLVENALGRF